MGVRSYPYFSLVERLVKADPLPRPKVIVKEKPEIMRTHSWAYLWHIDRATYLRCVRCNAVGICNEVFDIPVEKNELGEAVMNLPTPEWYENPDYKTLTCTEIDIKNIIT